MANTVTVNARANDAASKEIDRIKGKINALSSSEGFKSAVTGVGMGVGMAAWGMLQGAIGGSVDMLKEAVDGAIKEEAGLARLDAAIRASVPSWDGNRSAIEKATKAGMDLGFSDDALHDSLARLVPITKNVADAQTVQSAAMDLARFKGIGLVDASLAIGKAMEGNKKMLKELGISVSDAGTGFQTLGEIQKVVAGQSEAYAKTTAGEMEALSAHVDDLKNQLGSKLVPAVGYAAKAFLGLADAMDGATPAGDRIQGLSDFGALIGHINPLTWAAADNYDRMKKAQEDEAAAADAASRAAYEQARAFDTGSEATAGIRDAALKAGPGIGAMAGYLDDSVTASYKAVAAFRDVGGAYTMLNSDLAAASDLRQLPLRIAVAKDDVIKAQKELNDARTSADKHAAELRLQQAKDELLALTVELTSKTNLGAMYDAGTELGSALSRGLNGKTARVSVSVNAKPGTGPVANALGGYAEGGSVHRVGELRPEWFIPDQGGYISPNPPQSSGGAARGVTLVGVSESEIMDMVDRGLYFRLRRAATAV